MRRHRERRMRNWTLPRSIVLVIPLLAATLLVSCKGNEEPDLGEQNCVDGEDNDQDGATDCDDPDCASTLACLEPDTDTDSDTDSDTEPDNYPTVATAAATYYGEDAEDWAGFSVAGDVDVNGDGENDLVIGAPNHDCDDINGNTLEDSGAAYVIFGPLSGTKDLGDADVKICGDGSNNQLGYAVALSKDITGDTVGDVIVSAPRAGSGRVYVLSGLTASPEPVYLDETTITAQLKGEGSEDHFGYALSVGYVDNNSANPTLAVGADAWSDRTGALPNAGKTYLFTGPLPDDQSASRANTWFVGVENSEASGRDMGMGDFNGDGKGDVAVGALRADGGATDSGKVYVKFADVEGTRFQVTDADATLSGVEEAGGVGQVVDLAGDINDDGVDDLLVGAHTAGGRSENGAAYVWYGSYDGWSDATTGDVDLVLKGVTAFDRLGHGAAGVGDVTADGIDDIAVGALGADFGSLSLSGATYIVAGGSALGGSYDIENTDFTVWTGAVRDEQTGHRVAKGGDLTADDRDDVIVGAYTNRTNGEKAGAVYILASPFTELE